ncbi:MAG: DUF4395 domain-containing protein [Actinomycetota bacterium]|nr:DUF4395 domain-containing protein [Actinomycetota bacterium]MDH4017309.1 DUF4395 domain-containing protein [Actinomycetota bacterium]
MSTLPTSTSTPSSVRTELRPAAGIDPRGPRFGAAITTVVLSVALVLASPVVLAVQAVVFAIGAFAGPSRQPYGLLFKHLVRPRLAAPEYLEDPAAPRFAQLCGLAFSTIGLVGFALGAQWLALAAIGLALGAAFLNAAFDFCIGCEIYLRAQRLRRQL